MQKYSKKHTHEGIALESNAEQETIIEHIAI